jgi:hypothetical protein
MRIASLGQLHLFKGKRQKGERPRPALEFRTACAFADTLDRCADPAWLWTHFPAGELRSAATGARLKRQGLKPGWPDYLFISPGGRLHCLELKRRGSKLSDAQEAFGAWCSHRPSVRWCVAYSYDEAIATVTAWGVLRREVQPQ